MTKYRTSLVLACISLSLSTGCLKNPDPNIYADNPDFFLVVKFIEAFGRQDLEAMMACIDEKGGMIDIDVGIPKKMLKADLAVRFSKYKSHPFKIGVPVYGENRPNKKVVFIPVDQGGGVQTMGFSFTKGLIDRYFYVIP